MALRLLSFLVAGALVVPAYVLGQTTSGTLTVTESKDPNESPPTINADECNAADPDGNAVTDNLTFHWTFTSSNFATTDSVRIDVSNTTGCPTTNASSNIFTATLVPSISNPTATDQWPRQTDTSTKVTAQQLIAAIPSGAGISCTASTNPSIFVCANDTTISVVANGSITLNTLAPGAPTGVTAAAGDSALNVGWTAPSGSPAATAYLVRATAEDQTQDAGNHDSGQITGNSFRLGGLKNGVTYTVVVFAFSQFSNRSQASGSTTGMPQPVVDFWTGYKNAGGVEPGGCAAGSAGMLAPLLLPLALRRRRRS